MSLFALQDLNLHPPDVRWTLNNESNQGKNIGVEGLIFAQLGGGMREKFSFNVTGQLTLLLHLKPN